MLHPVTSLLSPSPMFLYVNVMLSHMPMAFYFIFVFSYCSHFLYMTKHACDIHPFKHRIGVFGHNVRYMRSIYKIDLFSGLAECGNPCLSAIVVSAK